MQGLELGTPPKRTMETRSLRQKIRSILCVQTVSTADIAAKQTLSQQLMSPREEGKIQERNNGRRDKERKEDEAKSEDGKYSRGSESKTNTRPLNH